MSELSEFGQKAQTKSGFMKVAKVTVVRSKRMILGRRKRNQLLAGRSRV